jgi:hypothetical protein
MNTGFMTGKKRRQGLVMQLKPIGIIHSPHKRAAGTPIQSVLAGVVSFLTFDTTLVIADAFSDSVDLEVHQTGPQ